MPQADLVQLTTRVQYATNGNFTQLPITLDIGSNLVNLAQPASYNQINSGNPGLPYQTLINLPTNASTQTIALGAIFLSIQYVVVYNLSYDGLIEFTFDYQDVSNTVHHNKVGLGPRQITTLGSNSQQLSYSSGTYGYIVPATSLVFTGYTGTSGSGLQAQLVVTGVAAT